MSSKKNNKRSKPAVSEIKDLMTVTIRFQHGPEQMILSPRSEWAGEGKSQRHGVPWSSFSRWKPVAKDKIVTEDGQDVFAVWLCEGKCPETNKKCEYSVYEWGHGRTSRVSGQLNVHLKDYHYDFLQTPTTNKLNEALDHDPDAVLDSRAVWISRNEWIKLWLGMGYPFKKVCDLTPMKALLKSYKVPVVSRKTFVKLAVDMVYGTLSTIREILLECYVVFTCDASPLLNRKQMLSRCCYVVTRAGVFMYLPLGCVYAPGMVNAGHYKVQVEQCWETFGLTVKNWGSAAPARQDESSDEETSSDEEAETQTSSPEKKIHPLEGAVCSFGADMGAGANGAATDTGTSNILLGSYSLLALILYYLSYFITTPVPSRYHLITSSMVSQYRIVTIITTSVLYDYPCSILLSA
jgi:hypothetical protein